MEIKYYLLYGSNLVAKRMVEKHYLRTKGKLRVNSANKVKRKTDGWEILFEDCGQSEEQSEGQTDGEKDQACQPQYRPCSEQRRQASTKGGHGTPVHALTMCLTPSPRHHDQLLCMDVVHMGRQGAQNTPEGTQGTQVGTLVHTGIHTGT